MNGKAYQSTNPNGDCGFTAVAQSHFLSTLEGPERRAFLNNFERDSKENKLIWGLKEGLDLRQNMVSKVEEIEALKNLYDQEKMGGTINVEEFWMFKVSADPETFEKQMKLEDNPLNLTREQVQEVLDKKSAFSKSNNNNPLQFLWCKEVHFTILAEVLQKPILVVQKDDEDKIGRMTMHNSMKAQDMNPSSKFNIYRDNGFVLPNIVFHRDCLVVVFDGKCHFWFTFLDVNEGKSDSDFLQEKMNIWNANEMNILNFKFIKEDRKQIILSFLNKF